MQINGFNKTTLLDYPGHLASTIFLGGCNMRCPFCHNASLVTNVSTQPIIPVEEVLSYLDKRKNILEGVCITGGEPTLYHDLPEFIASIKALGFKVKLDTNGTHPTMLRALINDSLLDYVSIDIKNSPAKYGVTAGVSDFDITPILESMSILLTGTLDYEFRTTIVKELHTEEDILSIGQWLQGATAYYLQCYKDSGDILSPGWSSPSPETLAHYAALLSPYLKHVYVRGIEP